LRLGATGWLGSLPAIEDTPKPAVRASGFGCLPDAQNHYFRKSRIRRPLCLGAVTRGPASYRLLTARGGHRRILGKASALPHDWLYSSTVVSISGVKGERDE